MSHVEVAEYKYFVNVLKHFFLGICTLLSIFLIMFYFYSQDLCINICIFYCLNMGKHADYYCI